MKIIKLYKNENTLIKKAAAADRDAQERLYNKYAPKMLSVCRQYIKDLQFAEDVMVCAFLKVFKYLDTFKFEGSFEGWVRKIMVRECITYLRKKQHIVFDDEVYERSAPKHITSTPDLDVEQVQLLIDALPEGYKIVFVMYAIEGYKHFEIAEQLGISENTSRSQLFKARKMLQEKLEKIKTTDSVTIES
ncbi:MULTISPECIES: RNA polymerase sigma factor [Cellulophaga]|uniref:RNA polymerase, sigma-24 subunit, ECF subfamily n=2 Tax=Cellulophaga TaxID=104264 RepID=F0RDQ9_CELLC|nr:MULTISPECIES: RNA polymerase sigma factor [Cellulophaga]ADY29820.1 RNA polymerase, sigma-24 subunit, ECF subfamily [Cellulophaga lytica DSM 7489]AIM60819.1 RNA polymerase sigma-70 factor [Cellulophaga lytica]APU10691.1 RNA polymerase subunit sigma-70 [Cellulophaga lytica]EWH15132.1 ECF subfamily RNA polymerase sigma-24 subunit [Cellulophaga geojensis KL-A]MDO6854524.1 RNA polymerase sigma factor [Cellulophaga lytica]